MARYDRSVCGARAAILHSLARSLVGAVLLAAAGCAGVPDVDDSLAKINVARQCGGTKPAIVDADGALSARQSAAVLDDVADDAGQPELLERHRAVEEAVAGSPLTAGNKTQLLRDGDGTFAGVFEAIRARQASRPPGILYPGGREPGRRAARATC